MTDQLQYVADTIWFLRWILVLIAFVALGGSLAISHNERNWLEGQVEKLEAENAALRALREDRPHVIALQPRKTEADR